MSKVIKTPMGKGGKAKSQIPMGMGKKHPAMKGKKSGC